MLFKDVLCFNGRLLLSADEVGLCLGKVTYPRNEGQGKEAQEGKK